MIAPVRWKASSAANLSQLKGQQTNLLNPKTQFPFVVSKLPLKILLASAAAWASAEACLAKSFASAVSRK
jgi:hypothetical protein